jgi:hypothetical protein
MYKFSVLKGRDKKQYIFGDFLNSKPTLDIVKKLHQDTSN